jgi:hypothetical protein
MGKPNPLKDNIEFSLSQSGHDLNTYFGRVRHFISVVNPIHFFLHSTSSILEAQKTIEGFKIREEIAQNLGSKIKIPKEEAENILKA